MQGRKQSKRATAIALAFISAAALVVGGFGDRWLQTQEGIGFELNDVPYRSGNIGLLSFAACQSECTSMSNTDLMPALDKWIATLKQRNQGAPVNVQQKVPYPPWHGFPVVGIIALVAALLAAAGLVCGGLLALANKRMEMVVMPTTIAVLGLAISIINGCLFVATKPDIGSMSVGWTFGAWGAGAVLGLAAVFPLNRAIRPIDEEIGVASATMSWGTSRDDQP
ncbi:MAG TPA: hypothetical protein VFV99_01190 [Kofleriaceae bacterium]|nr:hypothetical protein [Kofleriaceae bacterium]